MRFERIVARLQVGGFTIKLRWPIKNTLRLIFLSLHAPDEHLEIQTIVEETVSSPPSTRLSVPVVHPLSPPYHMDPTDRHDHRHGWLSCMDVSSDT